MAPSLINLASSGWRTAAAGEISADALATTRATLQLLARRSREVAPGTAPSDGH